MAVHLFKRAAIAQRSGRNMGMGPPAIGLLPRPTALYRLSGTTLDSTGAALGSCTTKLFTTVDDVKQAELVSDPTTGVFTFYASLGKTYYVVAFKNGNPAGVSLDTLVVTAA
jgi:hypothetical protein